MKGFCFATIFSAIALQSAYGQVQNEVPAPYVDSGIVSWDFHSKTIGEDYTIYVNTPDGYDTTKTSYPVLYETDGDWNVITSIDCFSMLQQDYQTTVPVIVGIGYGKRPNQRGRDLNPSTGGPKFWDFIEKEVMPFIQSRYRVNEHRALYGYSLGGLFTTSVLFEHPGIFETIFIGAPGNSGRNLVPSARNYFANHSDLSCKVSVGVGSFETLTAENVGKFEAYLASRHCKNLVLGKMIVPGAGHGAGIGPVMQSGLKFAYCRRHIPVTLTEKQMRKYVGEYRSAEFATIKFSIFQKSGKLYFLQQIGNNRPVQFVPGGKDSFFMIENEKTDIFYREEDGKKFLLFEVPGEKAQRLDKVEGGRSTAAPTP